MEISNRSVGYLCLTALAVAAILRVGNQPKTAAKAVDADLVVSSTSIQPQKTRVLNSDFRFIEQSNQGSTSDPDSLVSGNPVSASPDTPASSAPPANAQDQSLEDDTGLADLVPADGTLTQQTGIRERSPNTATWANDETLQQVGDLSNREVFDRWMSVLDDAERDEFRIVWVALSAEDRQQFLDDLRGTSGN